MIDRLFAYVSGALDEASERAVEDALAGDPELAREADRVLALTDMVRELAGDPGFVPAVRARDLQRLEAGGVRVHTQRASGGRIVTAIGDAPFLAARIPLEASERDRLDVEFCTPEGEPYFVVREAPFDPESGELVIFCRRETALARGALRVRVWDQRAQLRAEVTIENAPG